MDFIRKMAEKFFKLHAILSKRRKQITAMAAVVVFVTTYALTLPAISLDTTTAGMDAAAPQEPAGAEAEEDSSKSENAEASDANGQEEASEAASEKDGSRKEPVSPVEDTSGEQKDDHIESEEEKLITESTDLTFEGNDYTVTASVDADAKLPAGTKLAVSEITDKDNNYQAYYDSALEEIKKENADTETLSSARFFDITFEDTDNGDAQVEPSANVKITVKYDSDIDVKDGSTVAVVRFDDETGNPEVLNADKYSVNTHVKNQKTDTIEFKNDSFSVYGIAATEKGADEVTLPAGENDDYKVTITYKTKDVTNIPDDAAVSVKSYTEDDSEYATAKDAVVAARKAEDENFDEENLGLKALDISIMDGDKEIEPDGPVNVNIEVKDLPKDADADSTEVHHIEDGTTAVAVADTAEATDGTIEVKSDSAVADFAVDSFSVFTITWAENAEGADWPENGDYVLVIEDSSNNYYALKGGTTELTPVTYSEEDGTVGFDGDVDLADYTYTLDQNHSGYSQKYYRIIYYTDNSGTKYYYSPAVGWNNTRTGYSQTIIRRTSDGDLYSFGSRYTYYYGVSGTTLTALNRKSTLTFHFVTVKDVKDENKTLTGMSDNFKVTVSYGADAEIPEGATIGVSEVTDTESIKSGIETFLGSEVSFVGSPIDISIKDGEEDVEPADGASVAVTIEYLGDASDLDTTDLALQHTKKDGSIVTVGGVKYNKNDDRHLVVEFKTTSFSTYSITQVTTSDSLNGKVVAIVVNNYALTATAMTGDNSTHLEKAAVTVGDGTVSFTDDSQVTYWKFTAVTGQTGQYYIEHVNENGSSYSPQEYLSVTSTAISTTSTPTVVYVQTSDNHTNMFRLATASTDGYAVNLYGSGNGAGFGSWNGGDTDSNEWLSLYAIDEKVNPTATFWPNDGSGVQNGTVTANADGEITFPSFDTSKGTYGTTTINNVQYVSRTVDGITYVFSGWSTDQNANGSGAEHHRARVYQPGETATLTANTTYYAIWSENNAGSGFYIRLDGIIPTEPAAEGETENYQNDKYTEGVDVEGALNPAHFYANQNGVDSHLSAQPTNAQIVNMINNSKRSIGVNVEEQDGKIVVSSITNATTNAQYYNLSVGDEVYVVWYVIKNAGNGPLVSGSNSSYAWHVDGVLLVRSKVNLTYDANAPTGSFANMPAGSQWNKGAQTVAGNDGGTIAVKEPTRNDGYKFTGWAMYVDENDDGDFDDDGEYKGIVQTNNSITMNHDTHLVAQWTKGSNFLTVSKTDTSGNVLSGAKFTLEKKEDSGSWTTVSENLTTSSNGTFTYDDVTSQTVYRMTETYAPNGYETRNAFYFEVTTDPNNNNILGLYETDENGNVLGESAKHKWVDVQYTDQPGTGGGVAQLHLTIQDEQIKRKVQFVKEDQQGNKLRGAIFTLKNGTTDVTGVLKTEASGTDGVFSVDNATLSYGTYTLTETTAPTGYETNDPITITLNDPSGDAATTDGTYITGTGMIFNGDDANNASVSLNRATSTEDNMQTTTYTYTITIKDDPYTNVTVKKVANDANGNRTTTALTGATFKLTQRNDQGTYAVPTDNIKGLETDGSFTINSLDGSALQNLPTGTYCLEETAAPSGYIILTDKIYFSVNNGIVSLTDVNGQALTGTNNSPAGISGTTITVGNTPGTALPNTGGPGTSHFTLVGLALILASAVMYGFILWRKKQE